MTALWAALAAWLATCGTAFAQEAEAEAAGIDAFVNTMVQPVSDVVVGVIFYTVPLLGADMPLIVLWLVVAAAIATVYFNFIAFRAFKHALELIRGDYSNPKDAGEVSHFQALATALSGTVGLGNIAGVAIAVSIGGPGATFWMIVAGLMGMSLKFAECTLGVKYRNEYRRRHGLRRPDVLPARGPRREGHGRASAASSRCSSRSAASPARSAAATCSRPTSRSSSSSTSPAARPASSPTRAGCSASWSR